MSFVLDRAGSVLSGVSGLIRDYRAADQARVAEKFGDRDTCRIGHRDVVDSYAPHRRSFDGVRDQPPARPARLQVDDRTMMGDRTFIAAVAGAGQGSVGESVEDSPWQVPNPSSMSWRTVISSTARPAPADTSVIPRPWLTRSPSSIRRAPAVPIASASSPRQASHLLPHRLRAPVGGDRSKTAGEPLARASGRGGDEIR
jgi:hypothetical protein